MFNNIVCSIHTFAIIAIFNLHSTYKVILRSVVMILYFVGKQNIQRLSNNISIINCHLLLSQFNKIMTDIAMYVILDETMILQLAAAFSLLGVFLFILSNKYPYVLSTVL